MKRVAYKIKTLLPWLVAAAIFVYMFMQYPPAQVWQAVKYVNIWMFLALGFFYFFIIFMVDSYVVSKVVTRFGFPITMKETLPARGATYLVMNVNFPASQAMFAYYLKRTHGVPIFEALSIFAFLTMIDFYWIITLGFMGSLISTPMIRGIDLSSTIQTIALVSYAFFILQLAYWRGWLAKISPISLPHNITSWIRSKRIFFIFNEARPSDYLRFSLIRSPIYILIIFFLFFAIQTFDAYVPFQNVLSSTPICFLIGALPLTPGGIGTSNVAMIELLSPYIRGPIFDDPTITPQGLIFSVSLLWLVLNYSLKTCIGFYYFKKTSRDLFKPTEDTTNA